MNTEPITLAREVLDLAHEDETVTVCTIPDNKAAALARAVLRVADLADQLDDEAATCALDPDLDDSYEDGARDTAARIRTALNGDNT